MSCERGPLSISDVLWEKGLWTVCRQCSSSLHICPVLSESFCVHYSVKLSLTIVKFSDCVDVWADLELDCTYLEEFFSRCAAHM